MPCVAVIYLFPLLFCSSLDTLKAVADPVVGEKQHFVSRVLSHVFVVFFFGSTRGGSH
jgi:hypothetical protein